MSGLLAVESLPYRVLSAWVAMVRAGVVCLLCCLPIVTAPAAIVELLHTVRRLRDGRSVPTLAESLGGIRRRFWPSLRLGAGLAVGSGIVASAVLGPSPGGWWDTVLPVIVLPVAVTWLLVAQWALPVLEQRMDGASAALRYAYLRAIRRPDLALVSLAGSVALVGVGLLLPTGIWIPYWLTVPALWAGLVTVTSSAAAPSSANGSAKPPAPEEMETR